MITFLVDEAQADVCVGKTVAIVRGSKSVQVITMHSNPPNGRRGEKVIERQKMFRITFLESALFLRFYRFNS
jgi:hypothetical protein